MPISPLGGVKSYTLYKILIGNTDFLLVVNNIICSITHRFRVISDFSDVGDKPEMT